jgi:hypothetical protein
MNSAMEINSNKNTALFENTALSYKKDNDIDNNNISIDISKKKKLLFKRQSCKNKDKNYTILSKKRGKDENFESIVSY